VIPDEGQADSVATAALRERRDRPWPLIGLGLLAVAAAILLSRATLWPDGDAWWLFLLAGVAILLITRQPKAEPRADGTTAPMEATELAARDSHRVRRFFRWVAIVVASLLALLAIAVGVFAAVFDVHPGHGIGDRHFVVTDPSELRDEYRVGIGTIELDLSGMPFPKGTTHVGMSVDVGDMQLILPPGVTLTGYAEAKAGHIDILGREDDGWNADVDLPGSGQRVLDLEAHVGAGSLRVERAVR
jgi:hypothetical protein